MQKSTSSKLIGSLILLLACFNAAWAQTGLITGRIATPSGQGLEDVSVELTDQNGGSWSVMTNQNGEYEFNAPLGGTYTIDPYSANNPLNGVTTFDVVLISNNLAGNLPFTSPFQYIAADADCNNDMQLLDTIELRKLILGIYTDLPCAGSYRFVRADYVFPDPLNPFPFPETITIENLSGDVTAQNFIGIKIGDVNGSAVGGSNFDGTVIAGRVRFDTDENCVADTSEIPLDDWIVTCIGANNAQFTGTTDANGHYAIPVFPGNFDVILTPPNPLWDICTDTVENVTATFLETTEVDFAAQAVADCPLLDVDMSTFFLRRCFESIYYVSYCNKGTAPAEDAFVDVELDPYLTLVGSSLPWTSSNGNTYTFPVGDLAVGECGTINLTVYVSCEGELGQTHCSEARIYPDTLCYEQALWNGANLEVEVECNPDEVIFTITNTGEAMSEPVNYIVIEDIMVQMTGNGSLQLGSGESQTVTVPANGSTWRLEVDQVPYNPWNTIVSAAIEGCGTNGNGAFSLGFITQFAENRQGNHVDVDCRESVGAFDPNDKQGFPRGVTEQHFVPLNTEMEYLIRFQNTGTDTAFTVRILDTLSQHLDVTSIRPGSSSHPYEFKLLGEGVAQFLFKNILLPDSNVNEPASHGFVKFSILPKVDLPNNTVVENQAGIYFDFNEPVITNRTLHTFGEQFLNVSNVVFRPGLDLEVYPNPTAAQAIFRLKSATPLDGTLQLFDLQGKLVLAQTFGSNTFEVNVAGLAPGMYFFRMESAGQAVAAGKLDIKSH